MNWLWHLLGFDYGLPYGHFGFYNAWSGFGSDIGELALAGGVIAIVRRHNCEVHGCWRIGRHQTAGGHMVCRRHNPAGVVTHADVIRAHENAERRWRWP
jgi:hypothetical protein